MPSPTDRRVNNVQIAAKADDAIRAAMPLGDSLTSRALAHMTAAERAQIIERLQKARGGLLLTSAAAQKKGGR
jgi:DNA-binding MarR family transcriptional regulator